MYANDTCVTIGSEKLNDLITDLNNILKNISNLMRINKRGLYGSNIEFMVVGHRRKVGGELPNFVLNSEVMKRVEKIKYVGINSDENLLWEEPYKTVKNKLKWGHKLLEKVERHPSSTKA